VETRPVYKNRGITEILRQIRLAGRPPMGKRGNGNLQVRTKYLVKVLISKNRCVRSQRGVEEIFTDKNPGLSEICRSSANGEKGKWEIDNLLNI
jgi:hypothetical protein